MSEYTFTYEGSPADVNEDGFVTGVNIHLTCKKEFEGEVYTAELTRWVGLDPETYDEDNKIPAEQVTSTVIAGWIKPENRPVQAILDTLKERVDEIIAKTGENEPSATLTIVG